MPLINPELCTDVRDVMQCNMQPCGVLGRRRQRSMRRKGRKAVWKCMGACVACNGMW